ncbi:hypothetical protein NO135_24290, partial [Clostridioides difficile]|nr:hypothetical protein [Clostridioides difficile]
GYPTIARRPLLYLELDSRRNEILVSPEVCSAKTSIKVFSYRCENFFDNQAVNPVRSARIRNLPVSGL